MSGYLIFEEFGTLFDKAEEALGTSAAGKAAIRAANTVAKEALRRVPGSWMMHGISGEKNVDVDPVAALNKLIDGQNPLSGGINSFYDPYKGWIPIVSVSQTVESAAESSKRDLINEISASNREMEQRIATLQPGSAAGRVTEPIPSANSGQGGQNGGGVYRTGMSGERAGVAQLDIEIYVDASFPKILKMALAPDKITGGKKIRTSADIHLCTHAAIDMSQVTLGNNSPAAKMIQTLLALGFNDVVPYLSIKVRKASVAEVGFNLPGDSEDTTPTANITLEFEEIMWTYHVINTSNMNLFDIEFEYDIKKRKPAVSSLTQLLNPFNAADNLR